MVVLELPHELPSWAHLYFDDLVVATIWVEECRIKSVPTFWEVEIRVKGQLDAVLYPDAIRRR